MLLSTRETNLTSTINESKRCLVCKQTFLEARIFDSQLRSSCGDFKDAKRDRTADLRSPPGLSTRSAPPACGGSFYSAHCW